MTRLKLLTFDITNTILKVKRPIGVHYAEVARENGIDTDHRLISEAFAEAWADKNKEDPDERYIDAVSSRRWWNEIFQRSFRGAGYDIDARKLADIFTEVYDSFGRKDAWDLSPESHGVLGKLKEKGLILGVISNLDERIETMLADFDLDKHFEFVITPLSAKCHKPNPKIFQKALEIAQVLPPEAAHVGDDIKDDFQGARNVGMKAFLLSKPNKEKPSSVEEKYIISDLEELILKIDQED